MMLSYEEGLKLWNTRKEDWHKEPDNDSLFEEHWYNLVLCVRAKIRKNGAYDDIIVYSIA